MLTLEVKRWYSEQKHGVPDNMQTYRCGAVGNRNLVFPEDEVIENLAKKELGFDIKVLRRYDTCIIFLAPIDQEVPDKGISFVKSLNKIMTEDPGNQTS